MAHIRPLRPRDPHEAHRAATTLELFFDLVSVIAIAAVTAGLHHAISAGHGAEMVPNFLFLFFAIWWVWMNFTWFASAFDNDGPLYRVLVLVIITGELIFAGTAEDIYETLQFGWGLIGWIVMRLGMVGLWLRAAAGAADYRGTALRYAGGITLAQFYWVVIYFLAPEGGSPVLLLGALGFAFELMVPVIAETHRATPWHRHHIIERYGLLTIIVLGEGLLSVALGFGYLTESDPVGLLLASSLSGAVMTFALWWLYFAEAEHLVSTRLSIALPWGYGHVLFFGACAALGGGIAAELDVATHHSEVGQDTVAWYLGVPWAVALLTLWLIRDRHHRLGARALALPVMAMAFLAAARLGMPGYVFALLAVVTVLWRVPMLESREQNL